MLALKQPIEPKPVVALAILGEPLGMRSKPIQDNPVLLLLRLALLLLLQIADIVNSNDLKGRLANWS